MLKLHFSGMYFCFTQPGVEFDCFHKQIVEEILAPGSRKLLIALAPLFFPLRQSNRADQPQVALVLGVCVSL